MNLARTISTCVSGAVLLFAITPWAMAQTATNLKCNKCVSTKELANKAVTNKKLAKKAVSGNKIKNGAVNSRGIKNRSIRAKDLHSSVLAGLDNVIYVSKSGGDFVNPVAAMNAIGDAAANNRYLLYIGPGVYELGGQILQLKPFVEVHGAGHRATVLRGNVEGQVGGEPRRGVVMGANDSGLRDMRVEHTGGVEIAIAVANQEVSRFTISHVTAAAAGASLGAGGIVNVDSSPLIADSVATASGGEHSVGIFNTATPGGTTLTAPIIVNVIATASGGTMDSYGVMAQGTGVTAAVTLQQSIVDGDTASLRVQSRDSDGVDSIVNAAFNQFFNGTELEPGSTLNCLGNYDVALVVVGC